MENETPDSQTSLNDPAATQRQQSEKLIVGNFTGSGKEFFNIWIVNAFLSIITLGIYSAWATVRNRKYIYGHCWYDNHNFDFHGNPKSIVIGRMIAICLLALYVFGAYLHELIPIVVLGIVGALLPFLVVRSMKFKLRNTSYRNIRFNFEGTTLKAFKAFSPAYVLGVGYIGISLFGLQFADEASVSKNGFFKPDSPLLQISVFFIVLGILIYPLFVSWRSRFFYNNVFYGIQSVQTDPKTATIYKMYMVCLCITIGLIIVVGFGSMFILGGLSAVVTAFFENVGMLIAVFISLAMYIVTVLAMLYVHAYWKVNLVNHVFDNAKLVEHKLRTAWKTDDYWVVIAGNFLLTVFTLGFAYPWAAVRLARYKVENSGIYAKNLDHLTGSEVRDNSAIGDETADAFDFEFGL